VIIYLAGASGTGKSVMSTFLAGRLGINKITGTDTIREIMRLVFKRDFTSFSPQFFKQSWSWNAKTIDKMPD
jgi:2-phosphoglycerate kinase (EC 2.7.1.-)